MTHEVSFEKSYNEDILIYLGGGFMFLLERLKRLLNQFFFALRRFPESHFLSLMVVILFILAIEVDTKPEPYRNGAMACLIGVILFAGLRMWLENKVADSLAIKKLQLGLSLILGLLLIALYFYLPDNFKQDSSLFYGHLLLVSFLSFLLFSYSRKGSNFSFYTLRVGLRFLITFFYCLVLFAGISGIVFALEKLFYLNFSEMIYLDVLVAIIGLFGVTYFLSNLDVATTQIPLTQYPKAVRLLVTMILMPLSIAYTLIMYVYFIQILIVRTWPTGVIGQLVIWYGVLSFVAFYLLDEIKLTKKWQLYFIKSFAFLYILPLIMFAVTLGIRINQYGLTILRYMSIILLVWYILATLSVIIKKQHVRRFMVIGLTLLIALTSIGPLSGVEVSYYSQKILLERALKSYGMLSGDVILARDDLTTDQQQEITGPLIYLASIDRLDRLSYIPEHFVVYEDNQALFGFNPMNVPITSRYFYYRTDYSDPLMVDGLLLPLEGLIDQTRTFSDETFIFKGLEITEASTQTRYDLTPFFDNLATYNSMHNSVPQEAMTYEFTTSHGKLSLYFEEVNFNMDGTIYQPEYVRGFVVYKNLE